jgi:hypothetical protein
MANDVETASDGCGSVDSDSENCAHAGKAMAKLEQPRSMTVSSWFFKVFMMHPLSFVKEL